MSREIRSCAFSESHTYKNTGDMHDSLSVIKNHLPAGGRSSSASSMDTGASKEPGKRVVAVRILKKTTKKLPKSPLLIR